VYESVLCPARLSPGEQLGRPGPHATRAVQNVAAGKSLWHSLLDSGLKVNSRSFRAPTVA